jgi:hypothetical protein
VDKINKNIISPFFPRDIPLLHRMTRTLVQVVRLAMLRTEAEGPRERIAITSYHINE